jgi:hypothetical protein
MPTHRSAATPTAVTSSNTFVCPKPAGLADDDDWYIAVGGRGNVTVVTPPTGFDAITDATGFSGTSASNVRVHVYRKRITNAAGEPSDYSVVMSGNVFGMPFSWAASGTAADLADAVEVALLSADTGSDSSVASPAVTPTVGGTLVYRLMFMNFPSAGAASGIITPNDATPAFTSPSIPAGTQRSSGGLAYEAGPAAGVSSGTEVWTVGGAEWGPAVGITIALAGPSIDADIGDDQTANPGDLVVVDANGTVGADTLDIQLISGTYPSAHLISGPGTVSFIANKDVGGAHDLVFELTATAGASVGTDQMTVHVTAGGGGGLRIGSLDATGQGVY